MCLDTFDKHGLNPTLTLNIQSNNDMEMLFNDLNEEIKQSKYAENLSI